MSDLYAVAIINEAKLWINDKKSENVLACIKDPKHKFSDPTISPQHKADCNQPKTCPTSKPAHPKPAPRLIPIYPSNKIPPSSVVTSHKEDSPDTTQNRLQVRHGLSGQVTSVLALCPRLGSYGWCLPLVSFAEPAANTRDLTVRWRLSSQ